MGTLLLVNAGFFKLGLVMLALGAIIMGSITSLRKLIKLNKKTFFIYVICLMSLFALTGLLANKNVLNNAPLANFISFQSVFLILGSLHVFIMRKFFNGIYEKPTDFWKEFLYTIISSLFGLAAFIMVVQLFKENYTLIFLAAGFCFLLPFMIVKVFEYGISIPVPIYKTWPFPVSDVQIKEPSSQELKNPIVISFEFSKDNNQKTITNFKLKAPEQMELGKLFYFFVNDYNERHPEELISFVDEKNAPSKWIFYSKPNWIGNRKYYDYLKTVDANGFQENQTIVCKRV